MTTATIESLAQSLVSGVAAPDLQLNVILRKEVVPKFLLDIGSNVIRRATGSISLAVGTQVYDLPDNFGSMSEVTLASNLGNPLRYIGEDTVEVMRAESASAATPDTPTGFYFKGREGLGDYVGTKTPTSLIPFQVDWSSWLGSDTISSSYWTADAGITIDSSSSTTTTATVYLFGGTDNVDYSVTNTIVTAGGLTETRTITIQVRTVSTSELSKRLKLNCYPSVAEMLRYVYWTTIPFTDDTTSVDLNGYIPEQFQWGLVEGLKVKIYEARFGIGDNRYAAANQAYQEWVGRAIANRELSTRNQPFFMD